VNESKNFTEMTTMLMLLNDSFLLTLFRFLEVHANNNAERQLYALAAQDKTRHLAYASEHLKFALLHRPQRSDEIHKYLEKAERMLAHDVEADVPFREALTIIFGQGDLAKAPRPTTCCAAARWSLTCSTLRRATCAAAATACTPTWRTSSPRKPNGRRVYCHLRLRVQRN
jgi:hypothetical protein